VIKRLWLVVLMGIGLICISHLVAGADPRLTEADIIRSFRSATIDWRVEYLLLRGTLSQLQFILGICTVLVASGHLVRCEKSWLGRRGLAALLLFASCSYVLFALKTVAG